MLLTYADYDFRMFQPQEAATENLQARRPPSHKKRARTEDDTDSSDGLQTNPVWPPKRPRVQAPLPSAGPSREVQRTADPRPLPAAGPAQPSAGPHQPVQRTQDPRRRPPPIIIPTHVDLVRARVREPDAVPDSSPEARPAARSSYQEQNGASSSYRTHATVDRRPLLAPQQIAGPVHHGGESSREAGPSRPSRPSNRPAPYFVRSTRQVTSIPALNAIHAANGGVVSVAVAAAAPAPLGRTLSRQNTIYNLLDPQAPRSGPPPLPSLLSVAQPQLLPSPFPRTATPPPVRSHQQQQPSPIRRPAAPMLKHLPQQIRSARPQNESWTSCSPYPKSRPVGPGIDRTDSQQQMPPPVAPASAKSPRGQESTTRQDLRSADKGKSVQRRQAPPVHAGVSALLPQNPTMGYIPSLSRVTTVDGRARSAHMWDLIDEVVGPRTMMDQGRAQARVAPAGPPLPAYRQLIRRRNVDGQGVNAARVPLAPVLPHTVAAPAARASSPVSPVSTESDEEADEAADSQSVAEMLDDADVSTESASSEEDLTAPTDLPMGTLRMRPPRTPPEQRSRAPGY